MKKLVLLTIIVASAAVGCSGGDDKTMTKADESNFKGGPMPKDFKPDLGAGAPQGK